jgi:hypothetical protein
MVKCPHAASGCNYPEAQCPGHCLRKTSAPMPVALQLADQLDAVTENGADPELIEQAAAELRRLHDELGKIIEQRDELLEALSLLVDDQHPEFIPARKWKQAREAIAKAIGGAA